MYLDFKQKTKKLALSANKKKVVKNIYWAFLGKIVNMAAALFVGIIVALYLGPAQYGLMNYIISYVAIFGVLSEFGMSDIEIRELSHYPQKKEQILGTAIRIRLFFTIVAYVVIGITLIIHRADGFTTIMILSYALYLFTTCFSVIRNYFTSIVQNEYVVKTEIVRTIIGSLIKIGLLLLKAPLAYFIIATAFDGVLVASGYIINYNRKVGSLKSWRFDKEQAKYLIKESFPLLLSGAAVVIYNKIDQVMIGNLLNNTEVGYFATADKFLSLILFLPTVLVQTVTPLLVKKFESNKEEYLVLRQQFVNIVVWVSVLISAVVSIGAYWLIYLTFGEEYLPAVVVLQIMAWKTVGMALSASAGQLIILEKIQKWAVIRNILGCVVCVILNYIFIPKYGIIGSAFVTIVTVFVTGCLGNIFIPPYWQIFKVEIKALFIGWKDLLKIKTFLTK